jgi:hypothetical protein
MVHTRAAHSVSSISSGLRWSLPSCKMGFEMQQLSRCARLCVPAMSVLHQPGHIALTCTCGCARAHTRVCADIAILLRGAGDDEEQEARCNECRWQSFAWHD